jgi:hypothetical protein
MFQDNNKKPLWLEAWKYPNRWELNNMLLLNIARKKNEDHIVTFKLQDRKRL